MEKYDIAIIGTGPAGLSAALTAKLRGKNILLLGSRDLSKKVSKAQTVFNYLGLPEISGEGLAEAFMTHINALDIGITEDRVTTVYALGSNFVIQGSITYEADSVIVATGVNVSKPYKGELEFLGRGISYCATCDAPLYKGKTAAIVGFSKREENEAVFMAEVADKVMYFPMYNEEVSLPDTIEVINEEPVAVEGGIKAERLITKSGSYETDGIFFLRDKIPPSQLVPGLKMSDGHIEVDRGMKTNIAGCFACGDAVGQPYQYIKAAGEGNVAALSAVEFLAAR